MVVVIQLDSHDGDSGGDGMNGCDALVHDQRSESNTNKVKVSLLK